VAAASSTAERAVTAVVLDPRDERWRRFVDARPDVLPFHSAGWIAALAECYGFRPFVLALADGGGDVEAGLPILELADGMRRRRWIGLPFTDRCPPLLARDDLEGSLASALAAAAGEAGVGRVEVHAPLEGLPQRMVAATHVLDLSPGTEAVRRGFTSAVRRNIRRAEREGLVVRRAVGEEDVTRAFYRLHVMTRRRLGVPVQPRRFFALLWRRVLEPGEGHVLLAYAGDVPVAGGVFLEGGRTVVYKYGASDSAAWHLRPNNVLFAEAIQRSAEAGFTRFDFGRTDLGNAGLRAFKAGWGSAEQPLVYSGIGGARPAGRGGAERALGVVIRRSPAWVCRAAGETLYRYAA
jgi:CelD/BcsL family acetyltransferase involved in cellulose biosynthesis